MSKPVQITDNEIARKLRSLTASSLAPYVRAVRIALSQPHLTPLRSRAGNALFMPASIEENGTTETGVKVLTISAEGIRGTVVLLRPDGSFAAILDAGEFTGFRTALASLASVQYLERKIESVMVFGAGRQAYWHLRLLLLHYPIRKISVWNRSSSRIERLREQLRMFNADIVQDREMHSDIILCCTPSEHPLFTADEVSNSHIILVGSHQKHMREVGQDVLDAANIILVDNVEAVLDEAGEFNESHRSRLRTLNVPLEEGRKEDTRITIWKTVGFGGMDVAVAACLLKHW